jgi:hypothetical protein
MNTMQRCTHLDTIDYDAAPSADGCEDCLATGGEWVHLRMCQECGHVGCCDSSPNRHATAHAQREGHVVVRSFEPGESWFFCYADQIAFEIAAAPPAPSHG